MFSEDKPLVLRGPISKVELVNPHAWIWIDVKGERRHDHEMGH